MSDSVALMSATAWAELSVGFPCPAGGTRCAAQKLGLLKVG